MVYHDLSDIARGVFDCAIFQIKDNSYLDFHEESKRFSLKEDWRKVAGDEMSKGKYPFFNFWLKFSLGIEYLTKAVLINHEIDIFQKKEGKFHSTVHRLTGNTNTFQIGTAVKFSTNPWLQEVISQKGITRVNEISTGTLGKIYNLKIRELQDKGKISEAEFNQLKSGLKHITDNRRNNDLHFYFMSSTFINDGDLPEIYIPMLNLLIEIYHRN